MILQIFLNIKLMKRALLVFAIMLVSLQTIAGDTIRVMQYNLLYYDRNTGWCNATNNNVDSKDGYLRDITGYYKPDIFTVNEMNENLKPGQDCAILARVYDAFDNDSPLLNLGSNISSVYYTCEKKTKSLYTTEWSPVTGHNNVSAGADCVLSSLQTDDAWDLDNVGYNFLLSPEIRDYPLFETAGLYRIKATINPAGGDPITFYKEINVIE